MINRPGVYLSACAAAIAFTNASAMAGSHTWEITELFSTADGTIQFIEMQECCGMLNEINIGGKLVVSNANNFMFPGNLACCTGNKHLLIATSSYVALGVGPTPDYTVADGFFSVAGDTITYHLGCPVYDAVTFGPGVLPTDGVNSLNYATHCPELAGAAANSPTNFAGETASPLNVPCNLADTSGSGAIDVPDLLTLLAAWGTNPGGPPDLDGDGIVAVPDLLALLAMWGPC